MAYPNKKAADPSAALKEQLKKKQLSGVWLLCGEETYLSRYYLQEIRKALIPDPDMGYFDHIRLSGAERGETSLAERFSDACAGLPVMNEGKLIEIGELIPASLSPSELEELCAAFGAAREYPYVTAVILCSEEEFSTDFKSRTSALWRSFVEAGVHIVPFEKQDGAKLSAWCGRHFASEGLEAPASVTAMMPERAGYSMETLAGEIGKIACYLHARGETVVTRETVALVMSRTDVSADFGIRTAVFARDTGALFREYTILKQEKTEAMALFFALSSALSDLWQVKCAMEEGMPREEMMRVLRMKEYPLKLTMQGAARYSKEALGRLMDLCRETDVALKSLPTDGYILVERLICAIAPSLGK